MNIPASVAKKLHAVMADVNYIKKDKKNDFHKYTYASEQAIKEALHPILVKHGLLFVPVKCEVLSEAEIENKDKDGKPKQKERLLTVRYTYLFIDAETGECMEVQSIGSGIDNQDKAAYKSQTGGAKYALTGTFLIPTGDDPEHEHEKRGTREAQRAVADAKLGRVPVPEPPAQPRATDAPAPGPTAVPSKVTNTTKNFDALKAFREIKTAIGEKLYYQILATHGYKKSNEILELTAQRSVYKEMAAAKKIVDAASHGEIIQGMTQEIFTALPDSSVVEIQREFRKKMAAAFGTEVGPQEFDALRAKATTNYEFFQAMQMALDEYAQTIGA